MRGSAKPRTGRIAQPSAAATTVSRMTNGISRCPSWVAWASDSPSVVNAGDFDARRIAIAAGIESVNTTVANAVGRRSNTVATATPRKSAAQEPRLNVK